MKTYKVNPQIGKAKHSISFHDGEKTHPDGSQFWDIKIFRTQKQKINFEKSLIKQGYETK